MGVDAATALAGVAKLGQLIAASSWRPAALYGPATDRLTKTA